MRLRGLLMSKTFDKIMDGLTDALAYAEGDGGRERAQQVFSENTDPV